MKFQDYYELLGVARGADADTIKRAYRKLALKWHPDRHSGDGAKEAEERFKRISEAYEVLSDPEKRARYDRFGEHWEHGQEFTPPGGGAGAAGGRRMSREEFEQAFGGASGFSDFFSEMFGDSFKRDFRGGAGRRHPRYRHRGADVRAELALDVSDAISGGKRTFTLSTTAACPLCGGTGFNGEHVRPRCAGVGVVHAPREVVLTLPSAVRDGMVLRLRGLGEPGEEGGEPGDLRVTLRLKSDERYRLVDDGVEADLPLAPWEALRGAKLDVRTPRGTVALNIPAGTRAGTRLRLGGQGLEQQGGTRGDFFVVIRLVLPEPLTDRQRELVEELGRIGGPPVRGGIRGGEA